MSDIQPGHLYTDGEFVNGPSLTEHVGNAVILPDFISGKSLKSAGMEVADEIVFRDVAGNALNKATIQNLIDRVVTSGSVLQTKYGTYTANSNLTAVLPVDDTIPQNSEGTEIIAVSITPSSASNIISYRFNGYFSAASAVNVGVAIFRDSIINAIDAGASTAGTLNYRNPLQLDSIDTPSTISPITYRIRVGPSPSVTIRMNGSTVARDFGGVCRATLILQEIKA